MMTAARGSSNTKARRELGWNLRYSSWRDGFAAELHPAHGADAAATPGTDSIGTAGVTGGLL